MKSSYANWSADQLTAWMQLGHRASDFKLDQKWELMEGLHARRVLKAMADLSDMWVMNSWAQCGIPPEEMQQFTNEEMHQFRVYRFLESEDESELVNDFGNVDVKEVQVVDIEEEEEKELMIEICNLHLEEDDEDEEDVEDDTMDDDDGNSMICDVSAQKAIVYYVFVV